MYECIHVSQPLRDYGITHRVSRVQQCVGLEKRRAQWQYVTFTCRLGVSYSVYRSASEQAVMQTFVRKTFLLSPVKTKQTQRRQMRGQDRPMPCGVWAAQPDLSDNSSLARGRARRLADYKVLGGRSTLLHNVTIR